MVKFLGYARGKAQGSLRRLAMSENWGELSERLQNRTLTDTDINVLIDLLQRNIQQEVSQSGKFNVALGHGTSTHIGDIYNGPTLETIRAIIQELSALKTTNGDRALDDNDTDRVLDHISFRKLVLDPSTIAAINQQLAIIEEIWNAGRLPRSQQEDLRKLTQRLQGFRTLSEELQTLAEQGNALIKQAIDEMHLQLDALRANF